MQAQSKVAAGSGAQRREADAEAGKAGASPAEAQQQGAYRRQAREFCQARGFWVPAAWVSHAHSWAAEAEARSGAGRAAAATGSAEGWLRPGSGAAVHCRSQLRFTLAVANRGEAVEVRTQPVCRAGRRALHGPQHAPVSARPAHPASQLCVAGLTSELGHTWRPPARFPDKVMREVQVAALGAM